MIRRSLIDTIKKNWRPGVVVIIYGPRRVGKTVLLGQLQQEWKTENLLFLDGDTQEGRDQLGSTSEVHLTNLVRNYDALYVDEAQRIPSIGLSLKIIVDRFPDKKIVVTGSSSLDLVKGLKESLTGRNLTYKLFPFSTRELSENLDRFKVPSLLSEQLVFGSYPQTHSFGSWEEKEKYLLSLTSDYLFRDILFLERVNEAIARKLATMLAFQIGNEISLRELSGNLGIDIETVDRYLTLLEKTFVIFPLGSYSKNLRREVTRSKKYYFYDLGIRNALIRQFLSIDNRGDIGALWENFLVVERQKKKEYESSFAEEYFWRNYLGAEVDYLEVDKSKINAYEFKWGKGKEKTPRAFFEGYGVKANLVSRENYLDFVY